MVAEEVRSLAQPGADAARETATLCGEAPGRTVLGVEICSDAVTRLKEDRGRPPNKAVALIAFAAGDQRISIESVTTSVADLNHVTQAVAASAQESAAMATELNAQSASQMDAIDSLSELVGVG